MKYKKNKKEIITSPTIEQLKEYLNRINWDLSDVGCGYYRITNHNGQPTMFEVHKDGQELRNGIFGSPFGGEYCGSFFLKLSAINLSYIDNGKGNPFLSISLSRVNSNKFFISFYNH
jgi:hypothetical protein